MERKQRRLFVRNHLAKSPTGPGFNGTHRLFGIMGCATPLNSRGIKIGGLADREFCEGQRSLQR